MKKVKIAFVVLMGLSLMLSACTHLNPPVEISGKSASYIDCGKNPPTPGDMARHTLKGEKTFEWWYFDGHLETGETFVGVFHARSFTSGKPVVTFSLYGSDWVRDGYVRMLEEGDMKISGEDLQLNSSAGYIRRLDDKTVLVGWDMKGIKADFKLTTLAPGWLPARGADIPEEKNVFYWAVHQGRNRIEGTIIKNGVVRKIKGEGYADHNWGTKAIQDITPYWIWGRILAGQYTLIYANVSHNDQTLPAVLPLYIAKGDQMIAGVNGVTIRQRNFITHPERKRYYPQNVDIDYAGDGVEAYIRIRHKALVEDRDLIAEAGLNPFKQWIARTFIARPAYFRIIADYEGAIVEGGVTTPVKGECIYEIMGLM